MKDDSPPDLPEHQAVFDRILEGYNEGVEPLANWTTEDLVSLGHAIDAELQTRADTESAIADDEIPEDEGAEEEHIYDEVFGDSWQEGDGGPLDDIRY